MAVQTVTLNLSEELYRRFSSVAETMNQPLEAILQQTIQGNLPPSLTDLPADLQPELAPRLTMSDQALWALAQKSLPPKQWRRHEALLLKAEQASLSPDEEAELAALRTKTDQFVLRRSYALALLKWRGYSLQPPPQAGIN